MFGDTRAQAWTVVIPFKGGSLAKSRLGLKHGEHSPVDAERRSHLALAFLTDTVVATFAAPSVNRVIVVSSDPAVAAALPDVPTIADPGKGLNAAISAGTHSALGTTPNAPIAVLTGDLPSLTTDDVEAALELAQNHALGVVADHIGVGTTMITSRSGVGLIPRFGKNSHRAHTDNSHFSLPVSPRSTLRKDVDTPLDLVNAIARGVGAATETTMRAQQPAPRQLA